MTPKPVRAKGPTTSPPAGRGVAHLLRRHRAALDRLTGELVEHETLNGAQVRTILDDPVPITIQSDRAAVTIPEVAR